MISIGLEAPADVGAREALLDQVFGEERWQKTCQLLRDNRLPAPGLSFVAKDQNGQLLGTLRFWHIRAGTAGSALLLGPLAVATNCHGQGLGTRLMKMGLMRAMASGVGSVILVGDAPYYQRFGFRQDLVTGLALPGPVDRDRFLAREFKVGALAGANGLVVATGAFDRTAAGRRIAA